MKKTEKDPAARTAEDKNPGAGTQTGDKAQEPETTPAGEDTAPGEDTALGEDAAPEEEDASPDAAEPDDSHPEGEEPVGDGEASPAEEQPAPPPAEGSETDRLKAELLQARSQLAAYAAGVAPEMVADAVTLATAEAQTAGEVTEDAVAKAMENVLKRHPEWKAASAGGKKTGGFRLGADPDRSGRGSKKPAADKGSKKPWNKFNR